MKIYRYIQNYNIEILDVPFELDKGMLFKQTAKITFTDINNNLIEKKNYGVIDTESIYDKITKGEPIDISK